MSGSGILLRSVKVSIMEVVLDGASIPIYYIGVRSGSLLSVFFGWRKKIIQKKSNIICFITNYPYLCTRF